MKTRTTLRRLVLATAFLTTALFGFPLTFYAAESSVLERVVAIQGAELSRLRTENDALKRDVKRIWTSTQPAAQIDLCQSCKL